jgi:alpha,alpha-trehalose phosphorylase
LEGVGGAATYRLLEGDGVEILTHAERFTLAPGEPVELPVPPAPDLPRPSQPAGRAPARRCPA